MAYKKKLIILLSVIAVLALTYSASLIFDPQRSGARSASYLWLDPNAASRAGRIVINTAGDEREFLKIDSQWFVLHNGREYPVRQLRVEDLLSVFTQRASWPVRSTNASSHARFGLDTQIAARLTIYAENVTLFDLLIGDEDNTGRDIYLRRYGQDEVRSGGNLIASYIYGSVSSWYNLRLIPESGDNTISVDSVQRLSVYSGEAAQFFSRRNKEWIVSGVEVVNPDQGIIDSYIRSILNIEGDDFIDSISVNDPMFNHSSFALELGDGKIKIIRLSEGDESGRRYANVSGSNYIYSIASWAAQRLFRNAADFEKQ